MHFIISHNLWIIPNESCCMTHVVVHHVTHFENFRILIIYFLLWILIGNTFEPQFTVLGEFPLLHTASRQSYHTDYHTITTIYFCLKAKTASIDQTSTRWVFRLKRLLQSGSNSVYSYSNSWLWPIIMDPDSWSMHGSWCRMQRMAYFDTQKRHSST